MEETDDYKMGNVDNGSEGKDTSLMETMDSNVDNRVEGKDTIPNNTSDPKALNENKGAVMEVSSEEQRAGETMKGNGATTGTEPNTTTTKDPLEVAQSIVREEWPKFLFSPMSMADWAFSRAGVSWKSIIEHRGLTKKQKELDIAEVGKATYDELRELWNDRQGVCTSWCLAVTQRIRGDWHIDDAEGKGNRALIPASIAKVLTFNLANFLSRQSDPVSASSHSASTSLS